MGAYIVGVVEEVAGGCASLTVAPGSSVSTSAAIWRDCFSTPEVIEKLA